MAYILFSLAILSGICFKKNKLISIYILGVIYILSIYKYNCADLENYELAYMYISKGTLTQGKYMGHFFIGKMCAMLGFSFTQYLYVYYGLCVFLLYKAITLLTENINVVLSIYLIYSYGIDAIQMKTMLADTVVLLALGFLFMSQTESIKRKQYFVRFIILAMIGCTIHFMSAYFLLIGVLYYFMDYRKYRKYIFLFSMIVFGLSYVNVIPKVISFVGKFVPIFDVTYVLRWFERYTNYGWVIPAIACLLIVFLTFQISILLKKKNEQYEILKRINGFCYSIITVMPFFLFNTTFIRFFRVYIVLLMIIMSRLIEKKWLVKKGELLAGITFSVIVIYMYIYEIAPVYETTLGAILKYNLRF